MRLPAAGAILLGLLLVACQPSGSDGSPGITPTPTPLASLTPSDLSDMIPGSAGGITLLKFSMTGEQFLGTTPDPAFASLLQDLGADSANITVASGLGGTEDGAKYATVFAFRVAGAGAESMITTFQSASAANGSELTWHADTIGGKSVQVSSTNSDFQHPIVLYATGDILFFVNSSDDSITEDVLSNLP